jgi:uncharacterized protein
MKKETVLGIKALLKKRASELDDLDISWFGGEPLIAKDIILDISSYANDLACKYQQMRYSGGMTTNGYLLDHKTLVALSDVGIRNYQISLDGPREIHNKSRISVNGFETYDKIWENLLAIRSSSSQVSVLLRIHFSVDTFNLLDPLIDDIRKEFLHDSRFSVIFEAIKRLGGSKDESIKIFSSAEQESAINLLTIKLYGENFAPSKYPFTQDNYICYASRPNSLVIRANGDISKCTVALNDARNKIGYLQEDGRLEMLPDRLAPWIRGIESFDPSTLACPLSTLPSLS